MRFFVCSHLALVGTTLALSWVGCFPDPPTLVDTADDTDSRPGTDGETVASDSSDDVTPDSRDGTSDVVEDTEDDTHEVSEAEGGEVDSGCPGPQTREGRCIEVPAAPTNLSMAPELASLTLTWNASAGADGYRVSRCAKTICTDADFVRLTEAPISATRYVDETTAGPALPPAPSVTASTDAADRVFVSWSSVVTPEAPRYRYRVTAVNAAGESVPSGEVEGQRLADPVTGYALAIDDGAFVAVGTATSTSDFEAAAPTLTAGTATASEGTHPAFVRVAATGYAAALGAPRHYRVRAVTATRQGDVSSEAVGRRQAGALTLQWERSSGTESASFIPLATATSASFDDASAPADGATRWYRMVVSAPGADPVRSVPVAGWRLPPPGVPGGVRATNDLSDQVTVSWETVAGATGYEVLRNGQVITTAGGITALSYDDASAPAPAAWSAPTQLIASTTRTDGIALEWTPPVRPLGASVDYQVRALNAAGAGPLSAAATGRRAASALDGFEVERTSPIAAMEVLDAETTQWLDAEAPKAIITPGLVSVGFETTRAGVQLTSAAASIGEAAQATYRVRGRLASGAATPWSAVVTGRRFHGAVAARWQRSATNLPTEWSDLQTSTAESFLDAQAPLAGELRWYRVAYSAPGADAVFSAAERGARLGFVGIAPSPERSCGVTKNGNVWCWDRNGAARIDFLSEIVDVTNSGASSCAVDRSGNVGCWGLNIGGQLGDGTFESRVLPVPPLGLGLAAALASNGTGRVCARLATQAVSCWGSEPGFPPSNVPSAVLSGPDRPLSAATSIASELFGGCAVLSGGSVSCWGSGNEYAVVVPELSNVAEVAVGSAHRCARAGGVVLCWGNNAQGQLGMSGDSRVNPEPVVGLAATVTQVRAARQNTCIILESGLVKCWGSNEMGGSLGDGSDVQWSATPVTVANIQRATALGMSGSANCAIEDGGVWCWGENWNGGLGDGTTQARSTPVQVLLP